MARVYENRPCGLDKALGWLERLIYRASGIRPTEEMGWKTYAVTVLLFNLAGLLVSTPSSASRRPAAEPREARSRSPDSASTPR